MSGNGNGVDLAAIYGAVLALSAELRTVKAELRSIRAEQRIQGSKLDNLAGQVATYHSSVVGHGMLISELEERVSQSESRGPAT